MKMSAGWNLLPIGLTLTITDVRRFGLFFYSDAPEWRRQQDSQEPRHSTMEKRHGDVKIH